MRRTGIIIVMSGLLAAAALRPARAAQGLAIGSKYDIESQILGNMFTLLARSQGVPATYQRLGGTQIAWQALLNRQIDAYPEYTGTLTKEIFAARNIRTHADLESALAALGLVMSRPLGFNNTYAIGMKDSAAERLGITTISQLAAKPNLRLGFSNEFMGRDDGWPALKRHYGLPFEPKGYEHALLYEALTSGALDAIELYSTDSKIQKLNLRVLRDDQDFFPKYEAVILSRQDSQKREPAAFRAMSRLEGAITEQEMITLNGRVDEQREPPQEVAADFLTRKLGVFSVADSSSVWWRTLERAEQHIFLVAVSLVAAIALAVPLGIVSARRPAAGRVVMAVVGIMQTIPSLAMLMFMIPLLGLGGLPTIGALFLYSLLPIVRNTYTGIRDIPKELRESAEALGLPPATRLWRIELPLAARTILAGVKTAAVINVGTATIGGLIGAGGFGQPIVAGLQVNDRSMILWQGALPAAILALAVEWLFEIAERRLVPAGLRLPASGQ